MSTTPVSTRFVPSTPEQAERFRQYAATQIEPWITARKQHGLDLDATRQLLSESPVEALDYLIGLEDVAPQLAEMALDEMVKREVA